MESAHIELKEDIYKSAYRFMNIEFNLAVFCINVRDGKSIGT